MKIQRNFKIWSNFKFVGDIKLPAKKRLKTIEPTENDDNTPMEQEESKKSDMYQHIKEAKGKTEQVLDTATKEQAEIQHDEEAMIEEQEEGDSSNNLPPEVEADVEMAEVTAQKPEKLDGRNEDTGARNQHPEGFLCRFIFLLIYD